MATLYHRLYLHCSVCRSQQNKGKDIGQNVRERLVCCAPPRMLASNYKECRKAVTMLTTHLL